MGILSNIRANFTKSANLLSRHSCCSTHEDSISLKQNTRRLAVLGLGRFIEKKLTVMTTKEKAMLSPGEVLLHTRLGLVKFTADCAALEALKGKPGTIFVEVAGEVREVSLALVEKF